MGTLELQVGEDAVFAFYRPSPNVGGYLGLVWPGGEFKGLGFDQLRTLGNGRHALALDERLRSAVGTEPGYASEWERLFARFEFSLFMYSVGACVAHDVLNTAREVVQLEVR